ncbi:MAG: DUF4384 domain-containing protein [Methylovulum sp.]|uniref:DUF4384 domain-containing protein n=1 Tax=Methylovulum sp. TaxID=1916980 RepID=UPI002617638D|nr:DUF4384 domain-containing protein [Methylovulum sp.]MDD2723884.1 DUF4384 domain-containing protein [Methylovulum sp.]
MFADEGTSVMMNDEDANTDTTPARVKPTTSRPKPRVISQARNDRTEQTPVSYAGLQYWIDLQEADGSSRKVTTGYTFHSGDRIKLQIKSKTEGYLYVLNQDASGQQTPLYPAKGQTSGLIEPNHIYTIPTHGAIAFDNVPSNEKVTIALAKFPIPNSEPTPSAKGTTAAYTEQSRYFDCADSGGAGSKGMFAEESGSSIDCMRSKHNAGSKGMFAEEDTTSAEPASYSVVPAAALDEGQVLFVDFNLTHR